MEQSQLTYEDNSTEKQHRMYGILYMRY